MARTNGSRLAPLQAALQEERHSDRGGHCHLTIQSEEGDETACNSPPFNCPAARSTQSARLFECLAADAFVR